MRAASARPGLLARARTAFRPLNAAAAALLALSAVVPQHLAAQESGPFRIRTAPTIAANGATAEIALSIDVGPLNAIPKGSFVTVRGLPPNVAVKDGHAVGPGWWAVPLSALPSLKANVAGGVSGRAEIVISLIATDGRLLAQDRSALVVERASPAAVPPPAPAAAVKPPPAAPAALTEDQRTRAERLLARGEAYLANGNIMGARDFFERTADIGLAAGALRLGATYDPVVLREIKAQGVAPDVALARKWYERARDLGSPDATEPLLRLGSP